MSKNKRKPGSGAGTKNDESTRLQQNALAAMAADAAAKKAAKGQSSEDIMAAMDAKAEALYDLKEESTKDPTNSDLKAEITKTERELDVLFKEHKEAIASETNVSNDYSYGEVTISDDGKKRKVAIPPGDHTGFTMAQALVQQIGSQHKKDRVFNFGNKRKRGGLFNFKSRKNSLFSGEKTKAVYDAQGVFSALLGDLTENGDVTHKAVTIKDHLGQRKVFYDRNMSLEKTANFLFSDEGGDKNLHLDKEPGTLLDGANFQSLKGGRGAVLAYHMAAHINKEAHKSRTPAQIAVLDDAKRELITTWKSGTQAERMQILRVVMQSNTHDLALGIDKIEIKKGAGKSNLRIEIEQTLGLANKRSKVFTQYKQALGRTNPDHAKNIKDDLQSKQNATPGAPQVTLDDVKEKLKKDISNSSPYVLGKFTGQKDTSPGIWNENLEARERTRGEKARGWASGANAKEGRSSARKEAGARLWRITTIKAAYKSYDSKKTALQGKLDFAQHLDNTNMMGGIKAMTKDARQEAIEDVSNDIDKIKERFQVLDDPQDLAAFSAEYDNPALSKDEKSDLIDKYDTNGSDRTQLEKVGQLLDSKAEAQKYLGALKSYQHPEQITAQIERIEEKQTALLHEALMSHPEALGTKGEKMLAESMGRSPTASHAHGSKGEGPVEEKGEKYDGGPKYDSNEAKADDNPHTWDVAHEHGAKADINEGNNHEGVEMNTFGDPSQHDDTNDDSSDDDTDDDEEVLQRPTTTNDATSSAPLHPNTTNANQGGGNKSSTSSNQGRGRLGQTTSKSQESSRRDNAQGNRSSASNNMGRK